MRKILLAIIAVISLVGVCDAQSIEVLADTGDALSVDVTIYGVKDKKAVETAEPFLMNTIFFRGLPDSQYCKDPLVSTDEDYKSKYPDYFRQMEEGRFSTFITSARLVGYNKKNNKEAIVRFVVNIKALRQDLETKCVKRRFGF